ncbi:MAG: Asp23/Gls24 family envelope stress response protein [Oscillospiraceae bacterium]|nr:Asp23/Gls24 family envelope stress response protein [Oscillospiraceae bacterium]
MAENKQYINNVQDNGSVLISEDVICAIVENAVKEIEGVAGLCARPGADIAEKIGKKRLSKGMKIHIAEDNSVTVECNISVYYGQSVVSIAKVVQEAINAALVSSAAVDVTAINVNVCGIVRQ